MSSRSGSAISDRPSLVARLCACLGFLALVAADLAHAEVRCVHNVGELYQYFNEADQAPEGTSWEIRVRTGTYQMTDSLGFGPYKENDNKTFLFSGGWSGSNGTCANQTADPSATILQGPVPTPDAHGIGYYFEGDNKRYEIRSLRFQNFSSFDINDHACMSPDICPDTDAIILENDEFDTGGSLDIVAEDAQRVVFRNNRVTHMHPLYTPENTIYWAPFGLVARNDGDPPEISFNTFAQITCSGTPGGVMIQTHESNTPFHHNIIQTTGCAHDVYIDPSDGAQKVTPISNLFSSIGGIYEGNLLDNGNVQNFNPLFDAGGKFHLQNGSPAVNAGQTPVGALLRGLLVPPLDPTGQLRPVGSRYDIGAYESLVNDFAPPVITVTNTSDDINNTGSLRHAIDQANKQVGTAQKIVFNISGGCPHVILLASALPDVTDPLAIDGYTQPGSFPNDLDTGNDAVICILLEPAVAGIAHALEVPTGEPDSTQLRVDGIAFGTGFFQFISAAVELHAGSGHIVSGNAFGGLGPGDLGSLGSMARAVFINGTATEVTVGGDDDGARNTIGSMLQDAIFITGAATSGHTISNNYIGLTPNGLTAQPNGADGINAAGGTNVTIKNNAIAASDRGIAISGSGTTKFTIKGNRIGTSAYGVGLAEHANNIGIEIDGSSGQHIIGGATMLNLPAGAFSPGGSANDIRNNHGPGIYMPGTGAFVAIRGNRIEQNGVDGSGLGIDLGVLGQLANDPGDADSGANHLENHPTIQVSLANGATRTVKATLNTTANEPVRVDLYRSPTCPKGSTGANATTYLGSVDVNSGPTGIVKFTATVNAIGAPGYITSTATASVGHTSELTPCFSEDTIFADRFEVPGI